MKKTTKVVLGSVMTMALCASLIAGSTLALFSSKDDVNIAITSGKVDVKATVDNLTIASELPGESLDYKALGSAELTIDGDVVLSNFAPGDYANVDIKVTNNSTIFVKWNLTVSLGEGSSEELYNALDFEVTSKEGTSPDLPLIDVTQNRKESKWYTLNAATEGEEEVIDLNVKISFPQEVNDPDLMDKQCTIDLAVNAIQGNAQTVDPVAMAYNVSELNDLTKLSPEELEELSVINLLNNLEIKEGEGLGNWTVLGTDEHHFKGEFIGNGLTITYAGDTDPTQFLAGLPQGGTMPADTTPPTVKNLTVRNALDFGKQAKWDNSGAMSYTYQVNNLKGLEKFRDLINDNAETAYPFTGETVELTQDIDLENKPWIRIGVSGNNYKKFGGTFKNHDLYEFKNVVIGKVENGETVKDTAYGFGEIFNTLNSNGSYTNCIAPGAEINCIVRNEGDFEQVYTWRNYQLNKTPYTSYSSRKWNIYNEEGYKQLIYSITGYETLVGHNSSTPTHTKINFEGQTVTLKTNLVFDQFSPLDYLGGTTIFSGTFDGGNHTITYRSIYGSQLEYGRLVKEDNAKAIVKNLTLICNDAVLAPLGGRTTSYDSNGKFHDVAYEISSFEQLKAFRYAVDNGVSFFKETVMLTEDIAFPEGESWKPIGTANASGEKCFQGIFDGAGHKITNFSSEAYGDGSMDVFGLFASLEYATIKNLYLEGTINVETDKTMVGVGAFSGMVGRSVTFENCVSAVDIIVTVTGTNDIPMMMVGVGGFIGEAGRFTNTLTFTNCLVSGDITVNCNNQTVDGTSMSAIGVGGFFGFDLYSQIKINATASLFTGMITTNVESAICGAIVGSGLLNGSLNATYTNVYTTAQAPADYESGVTKIDEAQVGNKESYAGFNFDDEDSAWTWDEENSCPVLKAFQPKD